MAGIGGIILAAGLAERMGRPKGLLKIDGDTFLGRIFKLAHGAGLDPIRIVVSGYVRPYVKEHSDFGSHFIRNPKPERGQLFSLRMGLRTMGKQVRAVMVFLVDHPLVKPSTVRALLDAYENGSKPIVIPEHEGRRGHPVIFARSIFKELHAAPPEEGARIVVRADAQRVELVRVDDEGVVTDIDTPEQYERLVGG